MRGRLPKAFLVMVLIALPLAAWPEENPFMGDGQGGSGSRLDETLRISGRVCQKVTRHRPAEDVTYQAGVDVEGNPVTPADLPRGRVNYELPDTVVFDLPLNPFEFIGRNDLAEIFPDARFTAGKVEYDTTSGVVTLNGQKLNSDQEAVLAAACELFAAENR